DGKTFRWAIVWANDLVCRFLWRIIFARWRLRKCGLVKAAGWKTLSAWGFARGLRRGGGAGGGCFAGPETLPEKLGIGSAPWRPLAGTLSAIRGSAAASNLSRKSPRFRRFSREFGKGLAKDARPCLWLRMAP